MSYTEKLHDHLADKGWEPRHKDDFFRAIGDRTLASLMEVSIILEEERRIDEQVEAEKLADDYFIGADYIQQRFENFQ